MTLHPLWLLAAIGAELAAFAALARVQHRMLAAGGVHVGTFRMTRLAFATNALNATLPGGSALAAGYAMRRMREWGANASTAAFAVLASGVVGTVAFALLVCGWALLVGGGATQAALTCVSTAAL